MPKHSFKDPAAVEVKERQRPQKFGWRPGEWSEAAGFSRSYTYQLLAAKRLHTVKIGAMRIITTSPAEFLAAQSEGHDR